MPADEDLDDTIGVLTAHIVAIIDFIDTELPLDIENEVAPAWVTHATVLAYAGSILIFAEHSTSDSNMHILQSLHQLISAVTGWVMPVAGTANLG